MPASYGSPSSIDDRSPEMRSRNIQRCSALVDLARNTVRPQRAKGRLRHPAGIRRDQTLQPNTSPAIANFSQPENLSNTWHLFERPAHARRLMRLRRGTLHRGWRAGRSDRVQLWYLPPLRRVVGLLLADESN